MVGGQAPVGKRAPGMTLLEMTVVILVMLSLISALFVGAQAWKRGSDRALCILNIQNVQKGLRSYANLHELSPGQNIVALRERIIGSERFVEKSPRCPGNGDYEYGAEYGPNAIPPIGSLYLSCSLATMLDHRPSNHSDW